MQLYKEEYGGYAERTCDMIDPYIVDACQRLEYQVDRITETGSFMDAIRETAYDFATKLIDSFRDWKNGGEIDYNSMDMNFLSPLFNSEIKHRYRELSNADDPFFTGIQAACVEALYRGIEDNAPGIVRNAIANNIAQDPDTQNELEKRGLADDMDSIQNYLDSNDFAKEVYKHIDKVSLNELIPILREKMFDDLEKAQERSF